MLYQLSYIGLAHGPRAENRNSKLETWPSVVAVQAISFEFPFSIFGMERETGIEPATNSLEGCDSTTELLPPPQLHETRKPKFKIRKNGVLRISSFEAQISNLVDRGGFEPP